MRLVGFYNVHLGYYLCGTFKEGIIWRGIHHWINIVNKKI
jgi:hypothetical protein